MNKILTALSFLMICSSLFVGAEASIQKDQLTIWINRDREDTCLSKIAEMFTEDTGIPVTVAHPDKLDVKFIQAAMTGNGPDLVVWSHDLLGAWVKSGIISQVNPKASFVSKFMDKSWNAMTVDGRYYGYPFAVETLSLICNNRFIKSRPENFEDLVKLGEKFRNIDVKPLVFAYASPYFSYPFLSASGGYVYGRTGDSYDLKDIGVDNEGSRKGLRFIVDLIKQGFLDKGTDYAVMESLFLKNRAACIINGPWSWPKYEKANIDFNVYSLPKLAGNNTRAFVAVTGVFVNSASPNKELAVEFLENYLLTDEGYQVINNEHAIGIAALKSFQSMQSKDTRVSSAGADVENGEIIPSVPQMDIYWTAIENAVKNAASGRQSVEEALKTVRKRMLSH